MVVKVMCSKCGYKQFCPDTNFHPGYTLRECLEADKVKQKDFAEKIGVSKKHINYVIKGKASITPSFAYKLEKELKVSAEFWLRLQNGYDLFKLRNKDGTYK